MVIGPGPRRPGLSGLVLTALVCEPTGVIKANPPDFVKKGYDYLLKSQQPDGGIYQKGLANYCTSVCMMALAAADAAEYAPVLQRARNFIIGLQGSYPPESSDAVYNGGIGYDAQDKPLKDPNSPTPTPPAAASGAAKESAPAPGPHLHYDVSNTSFALEALHETKHLEDSPNAKGPRLEGRNRLPRALPEHRGKQGGLVKTDLKNRGGFVYDPLNKKGLGSYRQHELRGLAQLYLCERGQGRPRVTAVFDWLSHNYTLEENPGMDRKGSSIITTRCQRGSRPTAPRRCPWPTAGRSSGPASSRSSSSTCRNRTARGSIQRALVGERPALVTAYAVRTLEMVHARV